MKYDTTTTRGQSCLRRTQRARGTGASRVRGASGHKSQKDAARGKYPQTSREENNALH